VSGDTKLVKIASRASGTAWSPDGKRLAYMVYAGGSEEQRPDEVIEVRRADGKEPAKRLGAGASPAWSPDGQQIAFARDGEIWRVDVSNGNEERLVAAALPILDEPRWSPDGRLLAFRAVGVGSDILAIDVDGRNERLVGFGSTVEWSPDGEWIAFIYGTLGWGSIGGIGTMRPDGSSAVTLGHVFYSDALPPCQGDEFEWSPDSKMLAYWSDEVNQGLLRVATSDGSADTLSLGQGLGPSWAPDSQRLVYAASGKNFQCGLYTVSPDGGTPTLLVEMATAPKWSPDGRWIAFESSGGTSSLLTLISPDKPSVQRPLGPGWMPEWSPDSSQIAFFLPQGGSGGGGPIRPPGLSNRGSIIVQAIAEGAQPTAKITIDGFLGGFTWSPDGRRLAFTVAKDAPPEIYVVDLDDPANLRRLTMGTSPSWSPDGKTLVFSRYYTN
jgi:Tol biopolymer transport system component